MTHPWRTATVESGGESIYYEVTGAADAPAVVLTHGVGGSHAAWFQQVPALADVGYRVVTWDSRGFGRSTFSTGVLGSDAAVADLVARARRDRHRPRAPRRAVDGRLVGNGVRGRPSATAAVAHAVEHGRRTLDRRAGRTLRDFVAGAAAADDSRLGVHSALGTSFVTRDPARAFLYQQLNTFHDPPMGAIGRTLAGARVEHAALDATGIPILVITGTDDVLFPAPLVIDTASRLADVRIVEIADAGHSPYFERPDEYNAELLRFLAEHS